MAVRRRRARGSSAADVKKRANRFTAWSFSRLQVYDECPQRAKFQFLDKHPNEPGRAMIRGAKIGEIAEGYLNMPRTPKAIPPELKLFEAEFRELRKRKAVAESGFQFDAEWGPLDDWFDHAVWVRVKTDAEYRYTHRRQTRFVVIDFKTGKPRPYHEDQLELYALSGLIKYQDAQLCEAELWYLDSGDITTTEMVRDDIEDIKEKWNKKVEKMMADRRFAPNPGRACDWCPYKKAKGGPCEY